MHPTNGARRVHMRGQTESEGEVQIRFGKVHARLLNLYQRHICTPFKLLPLPARKGVRSLPVLEGGLWVACSTLVAMSTTSAPMTDHSRLCWQCGERMTQGHEGS